MLESLIDTVSETIQSILSRPIINEEIEDEPHDFEENKNTCLQLDNYPVNQINQILQDGQLPD